ncbi:MAG: HEAT repeat domain-containing protein [Clostridia bacterium]|nr:HEAT repeat domain-containing protein [Clostridia bacterium]
MKKLTREEIVSLLAEPNGPEKLAGMNVDTQALLTEAASLFIEQGAASALLVRMAANKQNAIRLRENAELLEKTREAISAESPKLRRNAARLAGALKDEGALEPLTEALLSEQTRFVRPSQLLALGFIGGEKALAALENYSVPPAADETEIKHFNEETEALTLALRSLRPKQEHAFTGLKTEHKLELRAPDMLTHQLETELEELGLKSFDIRRSSLKTETADYPGLFEARCFTEALFPIAQCGPTEEEIAKKAAPALEALMREAHSGEPPYRFRVELDTSSVLTPAERAAKVKAIAAKVENGSLANAPSDYEVELRVEGNERSVRLYAKLYTYPDTRFAYREGSIPASMSPAVAAAVLRLASEYLSVNARVIDPCCGSGTFLIERGLMSPCASLTGVDIAHRAIDIARRNSELAGVNAKYTVNDILRFECHRPYDELIANLPFGNRVGSHSSCEKLYSGLLQKLPQLVKKGGVAILYTMEFTLLKKLIREQGQRLTLLSQSRTEAGGLTPMIFILRVN